jgi:predicted DNA-binding WGR domain protein
VSRTYLEHRDPALNKHRFYAVHIAQTLFGDWAVIREWGRIGSPGTVREQWFDDEASAIAERDTLVKQKLRRGYSSAL